LWHAQGHGGGALRAERLRVRARVIAIGTRMPPWVRAACDEYLKRLRAAFPVTLTELEAAHRSSAAEPARARYSEGERLLAALRPAEQLIALDERGREFSTGELADWLNERLQAGNDLAFAIGGADGLDQAVLARSTLRLSLSRLTLPHALARVLLCEQLYRAHSILHNHPYHRA
jgi:23S rRNA (pseudouridine1915-N3)-methyltransferase